MWKPQDKKIRKTKSLEAGGPSSGKERSEKVKCIPGRFHFYNGNINAQMEAHDYAPQFHEDIRQAIIYDSNRENSTRGRISPYYRVL